MHKSRLFVLMIIAVMLAGCVHPVQPSGSAYVPVSRSAVPALSSPSQVPVASPSSLSDHGAKVLSLPDVQILSGGALLSQLAGYLLRSNQELPGILGNTYVFLQSGNYQAFHFSNPGVNLVCCGNGYSEDKLDVSFIECDADKVDLMGIRKGMGFSQIKAVLGDTEVVKVERGLPGLVSYELRYIVNGVRLKFFSWKEDGSDAFNLSIVKDFDSGNAFIRITKDQIIRYFDMSMDDIKKEFGVVRNDNIDEEKYGIVFNDSDDDGQFDSIFPDDRYDIDGLRCGMTFRQVMSILGKTKIRKYDSEEDPFEYLDYRFKGYGIIVDSDYIDTGEDTIVMKFVFYHR